VDIGVVNHYGQYVLKGGTSLSKGYRLISRFSEDVDLLLIPQARDEESGVEQLLEQVERTISNLTGLEITREKAEGGLQPSLLLHIQGYYPSTPKSISHRSESITAFRAVPFLASLANWLPCLLTSSSRHSRTSCASQDLQPCQIMMLHPTRTLAEKLCVVDGIGRRIAGGNNAVRSREARHYYDLWHLLDTDKSPAIQYLQEHGDVELLYDDCVRITQRFYGSSPERPEGGFASSVAFAPEVVGVVTKAYAKMCGELVFPGSNCPSLQAVVDRVRANASHL
jgi:hypothetical protein